MRMDDREMLLFSYGAMKAVSYERPSLLEVVKIVEEHLWPKEKDVDEVKREHKEIFR